MKQFKILSGKALLIELPEGAKHKRVEVRHLGCFLVTTSTRGELMAKLPPGNWRMIGMLSEVTEEQAVELIDTKETDGAWPFADVFCRDYRTESYTLTSALESLESALLAEGYTFDTDLPKCECKPFTKEFEECPHINNSVTSCSVFEAQSRVLSRERCLLLGNLTKVNSSQLKLKGNNHETISRFCKRQIPRSKE